MRRPIVIGNWKCHLTLSEASALVQQLVRVCETEAVDVAVCPPFTALAVVAAALSGTSIALGAQDLFWEPQGAFTGEISPLMLKEVGCRYVIIGHSERRTHFGETDESVARKLKAALGAGLNPIMCIGETLAEREAGRTWAILTKQLEGGLGGTARQDIERVTMAYEPVWAIGTGRNATPQQAQEAHQFIRGRLKERFGAEATERVRLQYGGSVNAENAAGLLQQPDVDGALVGGASLKAEAFAAIVKAAEQRVRQSAVSSKQ
jgi:triosephosphate isomerase